VTLMPWRSRVCRRAPHAHCGWTTCSEAIQADQVIQTYLPECRRQGGNGTRPKQRPAEGQHWLDQAAHSVEYGLHLRHNLLTDAVRADAWQLVGTHAPPCYGVLQARRDTRVCGHAGGVRPGRADHT
jgi:hypothetical protein